MIYNIKHSRKYLFISDYMVINENGITEYSINTTGFFLNRMLFPNFLVQDSSGNEILKANRDKFLGRNRHTLIQGGDKKATIEERTIHQYIIKVEPSTLYQIKLSGLGSKKWQVMHDDELTAHVSPDWKKWGWRIELFSNSNKLYVLTGLALIYNYFQDTGP